MSLSLIKCPSSLLALQPEYKIEVQDPFHRHCSIFRPVMDRWVKSELQTKIDFLDYVKEVQNEFPDLNDSQLHMVWLDAKTRENYCGTFANNDQGNLTVSTPNAGHITSGKWMFVLMEGKFYLAQEEKFRFHHSSLSAGEPVTSAGTFSFKNGEVVGLSIISGHYKPSQASGEELLRCLIDSGFKIDNIKFSYYSQEGTTTKVQTTVSEFLTSHCNQEEKAAAAPTLSNFDIPLTGPTCRIPNAEKAAKAVLFEDGKVYLVPKQTALDSEVVLTHGKPLFSTVIKTNEFEVIDALIFKFSLENKEQVKLGKLLIKTLSDVGVDLNKVKIRLDRQDKIKVSAQEFAYSKI